MNNTELVSIIVPVYNVEKYIKKCIESLISQNYKNIEIILVDDGSSDKSAEIIDTFAYIDSRIIVIHQKNKGVSSARNVGLKKVKGQFIMFVDGDDYVDKEYVSYFVTLLTKTQCDIGFNTNNYTIKSNKTGKNVYVISAEKAMKWIYSDKIFVAVWNKIYRTDILKKNNISFAPDIWYGEGMLFNIACLQSVNKVAVGERAVYHQTFNPDSAMRKFNLESNFCGIKSLELQKKLWKKRTREIERAWEYHYYRFNKTIIDGLVRTNLFEVNQQLFERCVNNLRKNIFIVFKEEKNIKKLISWMLYYVNPMYMAKRSARKFERAVQIAENKNGGVAKSSN